MSTHCSFQDKFDIIKVLSQAQDLDVWHQLLYGIRFFDLRVSHNPNSAEKFWVVHNFANMNPLYRIVQDVKRFIQNSKEIIIMDFHRFPNGFTGMISVIFLLFI